MEKNKVIKFFDTYSATWDDNMVVDDDKMNTILDYTCIKHGDRVLDIACGTGVMFDYYFSRGAECITGVDISGEMVKITKNKFKNVSGVDVICADAEEMKLKNLYDVCVVFNAFPHFVSPEKLIDNLYSHIKDGGTLTIAHDRGRKALDRHHSSRASEISNSLISEWELEKMMRESGFENTRVLANDGIYIVSATKTDK